MGRDVRSARIRGVLDERTVGGLLVFAAAAGFGTLAIFGKLAAAVGLSTATLLLFRFVVATTAIWLVLAGRGRARLLGGRALWTALGVGVVYGVMTGLFFWGLAFLPAGLAAVVFYTYPIHVFVISAAVLDERATRRKLLALALALLGVGLVVGATPTGADPLGIGLVLLAALAYATYATGSRAVLGSVDSESLTATAMVATTASMLPLGLASGRLSLPVGAAEWGIVLGIGLLGTALPVVLFVAGLERIEASRASVIGTSEPLLTVLLGAVLLGEAVTPVVLVGGGLVLCGVLLVQRDGRPSGMVAH